MKRVKNEPTLLVIGVSFVIACLLGWQIYLVLEQIANYLIKATIHSWLKDFVPMVMTFAVCGDIVLTWWLTYWLAHKMAASKETSDY